MKGKLIITVALIVVSINSFAQQDTTTLNRLVNFTVEDYVNLYIPSLDELIENSRNAPGIQYFDALADEYRYTLKVQRRSWLEGIKINSYYQHGLGYYMSTNYNTNTNVSANTGQLQDVYGLGVSFSLPLTEIFSRKPNKQIYESKIKEANLESERSLEEQALKIIEAYTVMLQNISILKVKAEDMAIAKGQYLITEKEYINGQVDPQTLSRNKSIETQAINEYEMTKAQLNNSILIIERLSHTKIISK